MSEAQQKIEKYLGSLQSRLRGLSGDDVREIVEELRGHILERAGAGGGLSPAGVDAALAALGDANELAGEYVINTLLARAEITRSPWRVLDVLFRWASFSVTGFLVLLVSIPAYFLAACFLLSALLKPFHPHTAGLWAIPAPGGETEFSLRLGFAGPPASGHEVLGWWIVPLGLAAGAVLFILTAQLALWCARQFRKSKIPTIAPVGRQFS